MKRTLIALATVVLLTASSGCQRQYLNNGSSTCGPSDPGRGPGLLGRLCRQQEPVAQGPPTAQVGYPYYTVRGPRDFFCNHPQSTGPY